jgi:sec-independent protein translocase protein TatA
MRLDTQFPSPHLSRAGTGIAGGKVHMFGRLGIPELLIILGIVILIFGANRLPELGRGIGKGIRNFKDATRDSEAEEKS